MTLMAVREEWVNRLKDMDIDIDPKKLLKWAEENPDMVERINKDMLNAVEEADDDELRCLDSRFHG